MTAPTTDIENPLVSLDLATMMPKKCTDYIDRCMKSKVDPRTDPGIQRIVKRGEYDSQFFCMTVMPDWVPDEMTYQHDDHWKHIDDETLPKVVWCAWRGFGKSLATKVKIIKSICYRQQEFILWVAKTHDHAAGETEDIKTELLSNDRITYLFGVMKAQTYDGQKPSFSKRSWFACDPTTGRPFVFVVPKGAGQPVRGSSVNLMGKVVRPTLIIVDDLEDDEEVDNEDRRKKLRKWFHGALIPCVGRARPNAKTNRWNKSKPPPWRIFYQDTLKHEDANIVHILQASDWVGRVHPQFERREDPEDGKKKYYSLVPGIINDDQVRAEVRHAKRNGVFDELVREKMCLPVAPEGAAWTRDMFKYYREDNTNINTNSNVDRFLIVDPAKTTNPKNAFSAVLAVGADIHKGRIHLRHLINRRLEPQELRELTFDLAVELNTRIIAVEVTGLEQYIQHPWISEAQRRELDIEFIWLQGREVPPGDFGTGKEAPKRARASTINPYYKDGVLYHEESLRDSALEHQELSYPKCKYWDAIDCAGYIPKILVMAGRFFLSQVVDGRLDGKKASTFGDENDWDELGREIESRVWALN